jgi:hypothetical protein
MTIHPNNTPDPTTTAPAVHVDKLSFRYRSLDDDSQPKHAAAAPAAEPLEQANAIEDISFSLPTGKLRHEKPGQISRLDASTCLRKY